ncbi:MAG: c-type cytochrome [Pseudomonadota bacterium]
MKVIVTAAVLALGLTAGTAGASQALAQKYACMSCHQVDKKVVGPALADVSKKYKGNAKAEATLVGVIKNGSKGAWGPVPMPPNPQVPEADAAAIAKWVLSL